MRARSLIAAVATAEALMGGVALAAPAQADAQSSATLAKLATLEVKGRAPKTGYDRARSAPPGPMTSALKADATDATPATTSSAVTCDRNRAPFNGCAVLAGHARPIHGTRRVPTRRGHISKVQIDHVVALSDAWQKGAQQLTPAGASLRQRSAQPAGHRRPHQPAEERRRRCHLVAARQGIPLYLRVPDSGREGRIPIVGHTGRERCDCTRTQHLRYRRLGPLPGGDAHHRVEAQPTETPQYVPPPAEPTTEVGSPVYYANCKSAKSAGAAPLYAGQPGYRPGLDRDGDGIACES